MDSDEVYSTGRARHLEAVTLRPEELSREPGQELDPDELASTRGRIRRWTTVAQPVAHLRGMQKDLSLRIDPLTARSIVSKILKHGAYWKHSLLMARSDISALAIYISRLYSGR